MEIRASTKISYGLRNSEWKISINGQRTGPAIAQEKDAMLICGWLLEVRRQLQQEHMTASLAQQTTKGVAE